MKNKIIPSIIVMVTVILPTLVWTQVLTTADEQRQIKEYKTQYDSYEAALRGLVNMQNTCTKAAEELENQIKSCEDNKEKLLQSCKTDKPTCDCQTLSSTIAALTKRQDECTKAAEDNKERLLRGCKADKPTCDCQTLPNTIATLERENENLKNSLKTNQEGIEKLKLQLEQVRKKLREKEKELQRKESEIKHLKKLNRPTPPVSSPITEEVHGIVVTKETSLNVRDGPGEKYSIIDKAPKGLNLKILDKVDVWYKIQVGNGSVGYVRSDYVKPLHVDAYVNAFPKYSCGDHDPGGINQWYPVWVDYSSENFEKIRSYYCRDAFRKTNDNIEEIQTASFLSESEAERFAQFMKEVMGSARVGEMTEH